MRRVLVPPNALHGEAVILTDPQELHHLLRVLRVKSGDQVECFDGAGNRFLGRVSRCRVREVVVTLERRWQEPMPVLRVTLAQALIKPDRFEWAVQKATELGVDRIVPLMAARTVVRLRADEADRKRLRWERIAREAATQCGRATLPQLDAPQPFAAFAAGLDASRPALVATLAVPTRPLHEAWDGSAGSITIAIGPEGDFTQDEVRLAQRHGAAAVSLGIYTLRSETAALAALAMVQYQQMMRTHTMRTRKDSGVACHP
ncbi:MAG: 16S rRNA (uracil(1498)-N(3))-methyltransferase [Candidatus Omnitrophica bacterium]|nr:16S rRNA (uracil(1498)-N(3))-methyltransferase [Candidatus Omnitrophota bacterium]